MTPIFAILGFAFVIFIHELGHFLFAKWAGVRVDVFSIGMGPVIWKRRIGETDYALSLLPLGGYVKMLGQEDVPGRVVDDQDPRSFLCKHPAWRAAILFGGVLFNLVSSWLILVALAWYGAPVFQPVVGGVTSKVVGADGMTRETPAWRMGLRPGDHILSVNGESVRGFQDITLIGLADAEAPIRMTVERGGETLRLPENDADAIAPVPSRDAGRPVLGIDQALGLNVIGVGHMPGRELDQSGPMPGDRVLGFVDIGVDYDEQRAIGQQVFEDLVPYVGKEVSLRLRDRAGVEREARFAYAGAGDFHSASLGLPVILRFIRPGSPAEKAGLQAGMVVSHIDEQPIAGSDHFIALVRRGVAEQRPVALTTHVLQADGRSWQTAQHEVRAEFDEQLGKLLIGVNLAPLSGGLLPSMNPALGQDGRPLELAGLQDGEAILANVPSAGGKALSLLTLPQAEQRMIAFSRDDWLRVNWIDGQGLLGKFAGALFGLKKPQSVFAQLAGRRVEEAASAELQQVTVWVPDAADASAGHREVVSLARLPESARKLLLDLRPGDWVASDAGATEAGDSTLLVLRSETTARWLQAQPLDPGLTLRLMVEQRPYKLSSWTEAFDYANDNAVQMVVTTLKLIPRFFTSAENGGIDASKALQGPIGIFGELSARLDYMGFASFLHLLALIGLNLFLINLLPIPIVDGGQLLFLGIEVIIRRPVPEKIQGFANYVGLVLIVSLMLYVIGNDIARRWL